MCIWMAEDLCVRWLHARVLFDIYGFSVRAFHSFWMVFVFASFSGAAAVADQHFGIDYFPFSFFFSPNF